MMWKLALNKLEIPKKTFKACFYHLIQKQFGFLRWSAHVLWNELLVIFTFYNCSFVLRYVIMKEKNTTSVLTRILVNCGAQVCYHGSNCFSVMVLNFWIFFIFFDMKWNFGCMRLWVTSMKRHKLRLIDSRCTICSRNS